MCCKVLSIKELEKPANKWCSHVGACGGCSIYETRPDVCRGFVCNWLVNENLGEEWMPQKCKFVMHSSVSGLGFWINVDPSAPMAWKDRRFYPHIKGWSAVAQTGKGYVAVCVGDVVTVVFPEEDLQISECTPGNDLTAGYRMSSTTRTPLVKIRRSDGSIREFLGKPLTTV